MSTNIIDKMRYQIKWLTQQVECLKKEGCLCFSFETDLTYNSETGELSATFVDDSTRTVTITPGIAPTGLEAIDEGNGVGWRLIGRDPDFYGNIGNEAIDLSAQYTSDNVRGATGNNSVAIGSYNTSSGDNSISIGRTHISSGNGSATVGGGNNTASGILSTILGGLYNNAESDRSIIIGGRDNLTTKEGEVIIGGVSTIPPLNHRDRIFNIGSGYFELGVPYRSDAFSIVHVGRRTTRNESVVGIEIDNFAEVHTSEKLQVGGLIKSDVTIAEIDAASNRVVPTKEWVLNNSSTVDLSNYVDLTSTQTISGKKTFTNAFGITLSAPSPRLDLNDTDSGVDEKNVRLLNNTGIFDIRLQNDANDAFTNPFRIFRNGMTATEIELNAPTIDVNGDLDVNGTGKFTSGVGETNLLGKYLRVEVASDNQIDHPIIEVWRSRANGWLQDGDEIGALAFRGKPPYSNGAGAGINTFATENWNSTSEGSELRIFTTLNGTNVKRTHALYSHNGRTLFGGNVGVNSTANASYPLTVTTGETANGIAHVNSSNQLRLYTQISNDNSKFLMNNSTGNNTISLNTFGTSFFNGGNVAIGSTTASERLDVTGNIAATGNVYGDKLIGRGSGDNIRAYGTSTGNSNIAYASFYEINGTTRQGYIGFPSSSHSNLTIYNDVGTNSIILNASEGENGLQYNGGFGDRTVYHSGNLRSNTENDARYVNVSGDTMTGNLGVSGEVEATSLTLNGGTSFDGVFDASTITANRTWTLPNKSGTIALLEDITTQTSTLQSVTDNGNSTTNGISVNNILVGDGSVTSPSISFSNEGDVGIYRTGGVFGNGMSFAAGGIERVRISDVSGTLHTWGGVNIGSLGNGGQIRLESSSGFPGGVDEDGGYIVFPSGLGQGKFAFKSPGAIDYAHFDQTAMTDERTYTLPDVNGELFVKSTNPEPTSATDTGTLGEIRITADYIYVCTATNTWKRTPLSTW